MRATRCRQRDSSCTVRARLLVYLGHLGFGFLQLAQPVDAPDQHKYSEGHDEEADGIIYEDAIIEGRRTGFFGCGKTRIIAA